MKRSTLMLLVALIGVAPLRAQTAEPAVAQPAASARQAAPIPDVATLMQQVKDNQKRIDEIRKNYRYRSIETDDELNGDGSVKKSETSESEIFFVNGRTIDRQLKKDGKDLSAKEQQKEKENVDKAVAKAQAAKPEAKGSGGSVVISISKMLQLGTVTTPRRMVIYGRDTLVFDFIGNTKAKSSDLSEGVMKDLTGTVWIDEADRQVTRMEARFEQNFHLAGGLLVNIEKGTNFTFEQARVNNEVWLPTSIEGNGKARVLLLKSFNGHMRTTFSDYHKYLADVKILPGATPVDGATPIDGTPPPASQPLSPDI